MQNMTHHWCPLELLLCIVPPQDKSSLLERRTAAIPPQERKTRLQETKENRRRDYMCFHCKICAVEVCGNNNNDDGVVSRLLPHKKPCTCVSHSRLASLFFCTAQLLFLFLLLLRLLLCHQHLYRFSAYQKENILFHCDIGM